MFLTLITRSCGEKRISNHEIYDMQRILGKCETLSARRQYIQKDLHAECTKSSESQHTIKANS